MMSFDPNQGQSPLRPPQQDDLPSYFNRSASAVRVYAERFEHEYVRPALRASQVFFDEHPTSATFLAIFGFLSIVPLLSFCGFSAFVIIAIALAAIIITTILSGTIIVTALAALLTTLFIIACVSIFLTSVAVGAYTAYRLVTLVRSDGVGGVAGWVEETRGQLETRIMRGIPFGAGQSPQKQEEKPASQTASFSREMKEEEEEEEELLSSHQEEEKNEGGMRPQKAEEDDHLNSLPPSPGNRALDKGTNSPVPNRKGDEEESPDVTVIASDAFSEDDNAATTITLKPKAFESRNDILTVEKVEQEDLKEGRERSSTMISTSTGSPTGSLV